MCGRRRNRHVFLSEAFLHSVCRTKDDALGQHSIAYEVPRGDQQLACQGHDHLLARGTAFLVRTSNHLAKALSFCNLRKRHASWIIPRRTRAWPIGRALSPGSYCHFRRATP